MFQDWTQLVPFFFLDQKIMIERTRKLKCEKKNDNKKIRNVKRMEKKIT